MAWVALIVVLLVPIWWGADASSPWDVDNIAPGSVLKGMAAHFRADWHSSYGPLPYYLTAAAYAPLLAVLRVSHELGQPSATYPFGFTHPAASVMALVVVARLVTLLLALGVAWLGVRDAQRAGDGARAAWVPVLLLGSAAFVYYARTSNVDLHALFWLWLGFHLVEHPQAGTARLALGTAAAALAVCCKEQVAPLSAVAVLWAVWRTLAKARGGTGRAVGAALVVSLAAVAAYSLAWRLPWGIAGWIEHHRFIFTQAKYPRTYPLTIAGLGALAIRSLQLLPLTFGPALLVLSAAALLLRVSWHGLGARTIGCALYLAGFIFSIGYVYPRFLLPLLLLALPLALRALGAFARRQTVAQAFAALTVLLAIEGGPALGAVMLADPRLDAENWLRDHLKRGARVEVAGNAHYQARVPLEFTLVQTSEDSLRVAPRGPVGKAVLVSSLDDYLLRRDRTVRTCWWDSLHAQTPGGRYRSAAVFRAPSIVRLVRGLPVAPTVSVFERIE